MSYNPDYAPDFSDPPFPKVVRVIRERTLGLQTDEDTMTFEEAKRQIIERIRQQRDHWAEQLRLAKKLTIQDVE